MWCDFCQMEHTSNSCYHPGQQKLLDLRAEAERLKDGLKQVAGDCVERKAELEATIEALRAEVGRIENAMLELRDSHSAKCKELEEVHEAWNETSAALVEQVDYTETLRDWQRRAVKHLKRALTSEEMRERLLYKGNSNPIKYLIAEAQTGQTEKDG